MLCLYLIEVEEMAYTGDWMLPNTKRPNFVFQTCVIFKDDDEQGLYLSWVINFSMWKCGLVYKKTKTNTFWKYWEYHFQDCGKHELWWMDPVLSDLLIFQYSEQKAPKALLTDSAIVSPRLYLNKKSWMSLSDFQRNAQETFVLTMLIRCTKGTLSNIEHTLHWSGTSVIKELIYILVIIKYSINLGTLGKTMWWKL